MGRTRTAGAARPRNASRLTRALLPEQGLDLLGGEPDEADRVLVRGVGVQHYLVRPGAGPEPDRRGDLGRVARDGGGAVPVH